MEVWVCFLGKRPEVHVLDALSQARLAYSVCESSPTRGPGIVFFEGISPQLFDLLREASRQGTERVIAIASSRAVLKAPVIWNLLDAGASDVFAWDHSEGPAREIAARFDRWHDVDEILKSPVVTENLAGQSPAWTRLLRQVIEVARFTDSSVLITGESGTGKELVARLVHTLDTKRSKGKLLVCDCTTIVPELSGSEFFGHERGAFTGAVSARDGAFAQANGGTLFLDEVGELAPPLQAELLRVTQEQTYKRVGGNTWHRTDFRLICATNRNLVDEQAQGRFRRDLYYRIANWACHLPPLNERLVDIPVLARHFIGELCPDKQHELDDAVLQFLVARKYPGNVRDLKQLVTRIVQHHVGPGPITAGDIPEDERPAGGDDVRKSYEEEMQSAIRSALASGVQLKEIVRAAGDLAERIVIDEEHGNLQRAAARLGVTDRALQLRRATRRQESQGKTNGLCINI